MTRKSLALSPEHAQTFALASLEIARCRRRNNDPWPSFWRPKKRPWNGALTCFKHQEMPRTFGFDHRKRGSSTIDPALMVDPETVMHTGQPIQHWTTPLGWTPQSHEQMPCLPPGYCLVGIYYSEHWGMGLVSTAGHSMLAINQK